MIVAILVLVNLLLMALLVWCLVRKRAPGEPVSLGILSYTAERYDAKAPAQAQSQAQAQAHSAISTQQRLPNRPPHAARKDLEGPPRA